MGCRNNGRFLTTALKSFSNSLRSWISEEQPLKRVSELPLLPNLIASCDLWLVFLPPPPLFLRSEGGTDFQIAEPLRKCELVGIIWGDKPFAYAQLVVMVWYQVEHSRFEWCGTSSLQAPSLSLPVGLGNILSLVAKNINTVMFFMDRLWNIVIIIADIVLSWWLCRSQHSCALLSILTFWTCQQECCAV